MKYMVYMRIQPNLSLASKRAILKLGKDISDARKRRRITMQTLSERSFITRATLSKVEKGDPAVTLGVYASVLFSLGLISRLESLADANHDQVGRFLEEEQLPKKIRHPKIKIKDPIL
jgi:transcriptional regulator with XRE-family HTH domain